MWKQIMSWLRSTDRPALFSVIGVVMGIAGVFLSVGVKEQVDRGHYSSIKAVADTTGLFDPKTDCQIPYKSQGIAALCIEDHASQYSAGAMIVGALGTLISGGLALYGLYISSKATEIAQRALKADRAWLFVMSPTGKYGEQVPVSANDYDEAIIIELPVVNIGTSPALEVSVIRSRVFTVDGVDEIDRAQAARFSRFTAFARDQKENVRVYFYGNELGRILSGERKAFIIMDITYRDIFSDTRTGRFYAEYEVMIGEDDDGEIRIDLREKGNPIIN